MKDSSKGPPLSHRIRSWLPRAHVSDSSPTGPPNDHASASASALKQHSSEEDHHAAEATASALPGSKINDGEAGQQSPESTLADDRSSILPTPAALVEKREGEESAMTSKDKAPLRKRFFNDCKRIIFCSWINWLLIFVPIGVIVGAVERSQGESSAISPTVVFSMNAIAIIPLASLLAFATESVATKMGDTIGALLNVTFGNAVELIVFIIALVANEIQIVQAAALGSILSNLLLILGMCFLFGGLRFREQVSYNSSL